MRRAGWPTTVLEQSAQLGSTSESRFFWNLTLSLYGDWTRRESDEETSGDAGRCATQKISAESQHSGTLNSLSVEIQSADRVENQGSRREKSGETDWLGLRYDPESPSFVAHP